MSFKRRIQTRTTTAETISVVSRFDPAIDQENSDIKQYRRTGLESHLVMKGEPCRFEIRALDRQEYRQVQIDGVAQATRPDGALSDPATNLAMKQLAFKR